MSTQADVATHGDSQSIDPAALVVAARALAESVGIDAEPSTDSSWPIDVGQRSVYADVTGSFHGEIYLSLAEDHADRLTADPDAAGDFLGDLLAPLGVERDSIETTGFRAADGLPAAHVVVRDADRIVAFGVTLRDGGGETPTPAAYEPSAMSPTANHVGDSLGAPMSLLADVDMLLTVELGRTTLPVRELLSLQPGMVVELDRQASAPVDVLVNGRLIARGEVVVMDEQFGLRVTEIVSDMTGSR